jgi:hypothetical protein
MMDGGVSYILVHQTGLADTAIAEDDNLFAVRPPRDTELPVSLEIYLQQLLARGHVVGWGAWRERSMLWIVVLWLGCCDGEYLRTEFRTNERVIKGGERFKKLLLFIRWV